MLFRPSVIFASLITSGIVSVFAQSGQSISAQCQSRLADIVASPDAQCINAAGLAPIFVGSSNTSVVGPIDTWLNGMCPKDACSNQTLAAFVTNITQGCSSDFSSLGLNNDSIPSVTSTVQTYYPTVRQILCLKDNSTGQLCSVDQLYGIQNSTGTVTAGNIFNFLTQVFTGGLPILGVERSLSCNNCTKEAYNIAISNVPQIITSSANSSISNQCGASFIDGNTPSGISQTATGNSLPDTNKSGALKSFALWDGLAILSGLGVFLMVLL